MNAYQTLLDRVHELNDLGKANALLSWDREVNMPRAGTPERIAQMTTLSSLIHRLSTSDEMGELIERAAAEIDGADYDSDEAALIRLLRRNYADERKLPADYVARAA
ncbi:MAG TPA: carboxypeptidase M32, partial [Promineifilum sp.]|nr:carboxypeptidase M32 [Promineifilum sp.]